VLPSEEAGASLGIDLPSFLGPPPVIELQGVLPAAPKQASLYKLLTEQREQYADSIYCGVIGGDMVLSCRAGCPGYAHWSRQQALGQTVRLMPAVIISESFKVKSRRPDYCHDFPVKFPLFGMLLCSRAVGGRRANNFDGSGDLAFDQCAVRTVDHAAAPPRRKSLDPADDYLSRVERLAHVFAANRRHYNHDPAKVAKEARRLNQRTGPVARPRALGFFRPLASALALELGSGQRSRPSPVLAASAR